MNGDIIRDAERRVERRAWLATMGISSKSARQMGLDRPGMDELAWQVLANEALRQRTRQMAGQEKAGRHRATGG